MLKDLLGNYIEANRRHLDPSTVAGIIGRFNSLMEFFGDVELKPEQIRKWQAWFIDNGRTPATINSYIKTVRVVYNWAVRKGLIEKSPVDGIRPFKVPQKRIRFFEDDEVMAMLEVAPLRWKSLIMLARTSGLRKGECLNLTVSDIDLDRMLVYVCAKEGTLNTWPWHAKSYLLRKLPLAEAAARLIADLINELPAGQPYFHLTEKRYKTLLQKHLAGTLSPRLQKTPVGHFGVPFNKIRKRAGVKAGTFHDLRRTFVTCLLTAGHPPHEVKELAGHADIKTTMAFYAGMAPDALERARRLIDVPLTRLTPSQARYQTAPRPENSNYCNRMPLQMPNLLFSQIIPLIPPFSNLTFSTHLHRFLFDITDSPDYVMP